MELAKKSCKPCEGGVPPLGEDEAQRLLAEISGWALEGKSIFKAFSFRNHYQAMAFVNAVAWISHREDHHPDMVVSYDQVRVSYTTHAIGGLSENDFICAAKIEALWNL